MNHFDANAVGAKGEDVAEGFLIKRGWHILSRNFRESGGELDIIGYKRGILVYFEVKTRTNDKFGRPADAVDNDKIRFMLRAVYAFRKAYVRRGKVPVFYPLGITLNRRVAKQRIDIIEVYLDRDLKPIKVNHIEEAKTL